MGFSQLLAFTGVSSGMLEFVTGLSVDPTTVILLIMLIVLVLGFFMEEIAIMPSSFPTDNTIIEIEFVCIDPATSLRREEIAVRDMDRASDLVPHAMRAAAGVR